MVRLILPPLSLKKKQTLKTDRKGTLSFDFSRIKLGRRRKFLMENPFTEGQLTFG